MRADDIADVPPLNLGATAEKSSVAGALMAVMGLLMHQYLQVCVLVVSSYELDWT